MKPTSVTWNPSTTDIRETLDRFREKAMRDVVFTPIPPQPLLVSAARLRAMIEQGYATEDGGLTEKFREWYGNFWTRAEVV